MIRINLLPKNLVPKKRNFLPHVAIAVLAAVLLLFYSGGIVATYSELNQSKDELAQLRDELTKLEDVVKQVRQLEQDKLLLSQKEQAVAQITSGRTLWSHELYVLADLVPQGMWLDHVSLSSRRRPVTVEVPNPNTQPGQPRTVQKTVVQSFPALRLTGYALSPDRERGLELVGQLINNIKQDDIFSRRFIWPEMLSIERQEFKEHTVMKFVVDCEIKQ
jgi:Tfp pilus assembly protein PilN